MALRELGGNFDYGDVCLWPETVDPGMTAISSLSERKRT